MLGPLTQHTLPVEHGHQTCSLRGPGELYMPAGHGRAGLQHGTCSTAITPSAA
jgi:hypothetical protein